MYLFDCVFQVKAAEAVFISGLGIFIINGRANKVTCNLKGKAKNKKHRDHVCIVFSYPAWSQKAQTSFQVKIHIAGRKLVEPLTRDFNSYEL